jgi:Kef-type K+ transport system membrane component KefB
MTPFLQLSLAIAVIVAAAKAGGYLSYRIGQPSVLGELIVGVIIGPTVLDILHISYFSDPHLTEVIHELAEIGVLLLMFVAGLELHLSDLAKSGRVAAFAGSLGVIFPLALGIGLGYFFSMTTDQSIYLGLILSATSVSISAQTLMEMQVLRSRVGIGLLGAAVFDDILVVLGLSIFTAVILSGSDGGFLTIAAIILRMILYLGIAGAIGVTLIPRLSNLISRLPISQGLIAFTVVVMLLYGWAAEELGHMAAITGAFLAGLMFARSSLRERIQNGISPLAYGLFVPIFFIDVGLKVNGRELIGEAFWLFVAMTVIAVIGKVFGASLGAAISGFNLREALQLGAGMISRGEVGLIVASIGITEGVVPQSTFSAVIGMVIITTLLTPPTLRWLFREPKTSQPDQSDTKISSMHTASEGEEQ